MEGEVIEWWLAVIYAVGSFGFGYGIASRSARREMEVLFDGWEKTLRNAADKRVK
jgi:hypothetical protein